jgi:mannose-1-phosphate guanylyltransferase
MVSLAGGPIIGYSLCWLAHHGIRDVAINLHHFPEVLQDHVRDGSAYGVRVHYSHETELLGSAGALVPLQPWLGTDDFVVLYGDVLTDLDLDGVTRAHHTSQAAATIVVTRVEDPSRCGIIDADPDGVIRRLVEKPAADEVFSDWANAGVYVCSSQVLEALPDPVPVPFDFASQLFPQMIDSAARLMAYRTNARVIDVGSAERLAEGQQAIEDGMYSGLAC